MSDLYNNKMEFFRETGGKQIPEAGESIGKIDENRGFSDGEGFFEDGNIDERNHVMTESETVMNIMESVPAADAAVGMEREADIPQEENLFREGIEVYENTESTAELGAEIVPNSEDRDDFSEERDNMTPMEHRDPPPDFALVPPAPQTPSKLISADGDLKSSRLKITGLHHISLPVITIEEDVLVPDVEPDLEQILNIEGRPEISSHEMVAASDGKDAYKIGGSISVSTLYLPVSENGELISINSRIDFRRECVPSQCDERSLRGNGNSSGRSAEGAETISAELLSIKAKVINERKIRISAELHCTVKQYSEEEAEFLEGVRDSELNLKKETIRFTDIVQRRRDTTDISGEIIIKDNMPEPGRILNYDINIVESRRQIGRGKAVIDAGAYYSILYMPKIGDTAGSDAEGSGEEDEKIPVFCRGKIDFTQFIKLPDSQTAGDMDSRVTFEVISSQLNFETPEEGGPRRLMLKASVSAAVDVFRGMEREIVTDMYHRTKNVDFSTTPRQISELCGNAAAEISVREIITLPETKPGFRRIPYISASAENLQVAAENGRCRIEGLIDTNTVYEEEDGGSGFSSFAQKLPFRTQIDIPGITDKMTAEYSYGLKDIWFDRMNARQVEFNCTVCVSVYVWNMEDRDFIDRVCYIEDDGVAEEAAGIVIYITRPGDTQWSIAKEFRTTLEQLRLINDLEASDYIEEGKKLLIL